MPKKHKQVLLGFLTVLALQSIFILFVFSSHYEGSTVPEEEAITQSSSEPALPVMKSTLEGWKPVYIYYGNQEAIQSYLGGTPASQANQDKVVLRLSSKYWSLKKNEVTIDVPPYFVDLAANEAVHLSNTYRLEQEGWNGLCMEPNPRYWFGLAHRKCAVAGAFVGGVSDAVEVSVSLENNAFGGIVGADFDNTVASKTEKRRTVSIKTTFEQFNVPTVIDYMSLDVEGAESLIMQNFPFQSYSFRFMSVERPKLDLQRLLESNGYTYIMHLVDFGDVLYVHESVLRDMSKDLVKEIVLEISPKARKANTIGTKVYQLATGKWSEVTG
jgi:hypothetical protein